MTRRQQVAELRRLVLRMQTTLYARRMARQTFPPLMALVVDTRLRLVGVWLVDEMRRVEDGGMAA
jgi:hypothetical protein